LPVTVKFANEPTLVIFGCAAVVTVPAVVALPAVVAAPDSAPTNVVAVIEALPKLALILVLITADELPFALDVVNVGYAVVEVDVFCNSADALVALATVPVTLAPTSELNPLPLPVNTPVFAVMFAAVIVPFTPSDVNVPTLVMFGCALVVTVPDVPAVATLKLATCVVLVTTNGAVPTAILDIS
jgi:hypothetical protein